MTTQDIETLVTWIRTDEEEADTDDRAAMRDLMGFIYSDWEWIMGDCSYADEQLTAAGLLRPQTERTAHCDSWQTEKGRRVAAALDFRVLLFD